MRIWTDEEIQRAVPYAATLLRDIAATWTDTKRETALMRSCREVGDEVGRIRHRDALQRAHEAVRRIHREVVAMGACPRGRLGRPWILFPVVRGGDLGWRRLLPGSRRAGRFMRMSDAPPLFKEKEPKRRQT